MLAVLQRGMKYTYDEVKRASIAQTPRTTSMIQLLDLGMVAV